LAAENGLWRVTIDAGCNAIELAVKSLILKHEDDIPGSHGGVVGKLGELFVRSGRLDTSLGRRVHQALEKRNRDRYQFTASVGKSDADENTELARTLAERARRELEE